MRQAAAEHKHEGHNGAEDGVRACALTRVRRPKDELIREVWGDTVVEENNLARHVSTIRKALGERPGQREYIATIPGIGYQFVASVTQLDELPPHYRATPVHVEPVVNGDHVAGPPSEAEPVPHPVRRRSALAAAAVTAAIVAFSTAAVWIVGTRDRTADVALPAAALIFIIALGVLIGGFLAPAATRQHEQQFRDDCRAAGGTPFELERADYCRIGREVIPR